MPSLDKRSRASIGERLPLRPDETDATIQACYELLASGLPLSEVLDAAKRISSLNKTSDSKLGGAGDVQSAKITQDHDASSQSGIVRFPVRLAEVLVSHQALEASGAPALPDDADPHRSIVNQSQPGSVLRREKWSVKSRLIAGALFWLIPAISLIVVGMMGKSLIDRGLTQNLAQGMHAIITAVQLRKQLTVLTSAEPKRTALETTQGALQSSATSDAFLITQAGLSLGGDIDVAHYWNYRARQLGAPDAESASSGQGFESMRKPQPVATNAPAVPAFDALPTVPARTEDLRPLNMDSHKPGRPTAIASAPLGGALRPRKGHQTGVQGSGGRTCPYSGHCLTPP
jgi:hypothetical protein